MHTNHNITFLHILYFARACRWVRYKYETGTYPAPHLGPRSVQMELVASRSNFSKHSRAGPAITQVTFLTQFNKHKSQQPTEFLTLVVEVADSPAYATPRHYPRVL